MKISYSWLRDFLKFNEEPDQLADILTGIGLEVEDIEKVDQVQGGLDGLVVGYVLTAIQHPNADRLKITTVDIGAEHPLQIVCGAPNVASGQKVVVAKVDAVLYPLDGESFKIKKSKIRGEVSEGMICAEDEIGIGKSHDGIMVLEEHAVIGQTASSYFKLESDYCFEIGLTPNRADAISHMGVARDIAAFQRKQIVLPSVSVEKNSEDEVIPVNIEAPDACGRYASAVLRNVQVGPSPDWMVRRLRSVGLKSINTVVDVANYVMIELGQPLHIFDAAKIKGAKVNVRYAKAGEKLTTLDTVERELLTEDLVIADQDQAMCIAGVFGGLNSGVSNETDRIFVESAYFNPVSVRKTAKRHGLKTDASFRYERGTDPDMPFFALKRVVDLLIEIAGAELESGLIDRCPRPVEPAAFQISYAYVNNLIGKQIGNDTIKEILSALSISYQELDGSSLQVTVPPYRVDVQRPVDLVEEILRIYGYNKIEIPGQFKASLNNNSLLEADLSEDTVSAFLASNGFQEIMNNSLTKSGLVEEEEAVRILNPLSSDLSVMRQTMLYGGLSSIGYNKKRKNDDLKFFEFGKTYRLLQQYEEQRHLAIFMSGNHLAKQWNQASEKTGFFALKGSVDALLKRVGIEVFDVQDVEDNNLNYGLHYRRGAKELVRFGEVSEEALNREDINSPVFYADFNWDNLLSFIGKKGIKFREIPKYPSVRRDLALLVDEKITFQHLEQVTRKTDKKIIQSVHVFDVYKGEKLPAGKKSYALSFTLQDQDKTLTDPQIDAIIKKLIINFEKETGAEVRK